MNCSSVDNPSKATNDETITANTANTVCARGVDTLKERKASARPASTKAIAVFARIGTRSNRR
ncbi:hypothetical protein D3C81_1724600 [compost metagenome]